MDKFYTNTNKVLDFMFDNHYSQHSLHLYRKVIDTLAEYLKANGLTYSPDLGAGLLEEESPVPFGIRGPQLHAAIIKKINAVYLTGSVSNVLISSRKPYSVLHLNEALSDSLTRFTENIRPMFSSTQIENITRRIRLFLKYLQYNGKENVSCIDFEDISDYHFLELSHLKKQSKLIEEGSVCHFLQFLADEKQIIHSLTTYMYALETDSFIDISSLCDADLQSIRNRHQATQLSSSAYREVIDGLISEGLKAGYVPPYHRSLQRALRYLELFLDIYRFDYSPETAEIWLNTQRTKEVLPGSSWNAAGRALFILKLYAVTGRIDFTVTHPRGISGLYELPEWMVGPLMDYSEMRTKEKLDDDTIKNDIYSILRFFRFLAGRNISSFTEVSADILTEFNLHDCHSSSEGKNACNSRIRRFLDYLYRKGVIANPYLVQVLGYSAAKSERIVTILTPEEINEVRSYITNAATPLQLQDSAIMLIGTEMGIRGCDIVRLKVSDVNFKNKTISFLQDKTEVGVRLAMPVSVGNAIFKYIKSGRPKGISSDLLFVSLKAPYKPLTRNVCEGALKRILPRREVPGSGFHVTRKTFSTYKLRKGVTPERISSAIGQCSVRSLSPYLSLDGERLSMCPLSLESLEVPWKGGF